MVISGPMVTPVSSLHPGRRGGALMSATPYYLPAGMPRAGAGGRRSRQAVLGGHARAASCGSSAAASAARGSGDRSGSATRASPSSSSWVRVAPPRPHLQLGARVASRCTPPSRTTARTSWCWWSCRTPGGVRMLGNLLGDPRQLVQIGAPVEAVFEPHDDATPPFTLVHWKTSHEATSHRARSSSTSPTCGGWIPPVTRAGPAPRVRAIRNKYFMVSADCHANEPSDLWADAHRRQVPRPPAPRDHRRERRAVARLRGPPARPAAHRRPRGRGPPAPAGGRRSASSGCSTRTGTASTPR